jgi:hypothetical protein
MDLSPEYVLLCSKAEEMQNYWRKPAWEILHENGWEELKSNINVGDIFSHGLYRQWSIVCDKITNLAKHLGPENVNYFTYRIEHDRGGHYFEQKHDGLASEYFIWLPRQDQLQDMVIDNFGTVRGKNAVSLMLLEFHFFMNSGVAFPSAEQLWIAFVMKEKFNKQWNAEKQEWENI